MRSRPQLVVAIGVVFTSLSAIFVRLSDAPSLVIAAWRMVFTTGLVLPLFLVEQAGAVRRPTAGHEPVAPRGSRSESAEASPVESPYHAGAPRGGAIALSVLSGTFLALHFALWITSLEYTTVASSTVLVTTHPIIVAILGLLLLRERLAARSVLCMALALAGSVVLVWGGLGTGGSAPLGNLLAFLGAVTVAAYMILGRIVRRTLSVNAYTMIVYAVAGALLVAATLATGTKLTPYPLREFVLFASLALFCTMLGHSLFSWALKYVRPTLISTSILGEPVIASLLAVVIFAEVPEPTTIVGGIVILTGIFLFVRQEARRGRTGRATGVPRS